MSASTMTRWASPEPVVVPGVGGGVVAPWPKPSLDDLAPLEHPATTSPMAKAKQTEGTRLCERIPGTFAAPVPGPARRDAAPIGRSQRAPGRKRDGDVAIESCRALR